MTQSWRPIDPGRTTLPLRIVVNGRFLTRPLTGVDRVAEEIVRAWDGFLDRDADLRRHVSIEIVAPQGDLRPLDLRRIETRQNGRMSGHAWEQIELPRLTCGAWLYNPCNTGPLAVRLALTTIHDAQVYLAPKAYSRTFRLWYRVLLPALGRRSSLVTTVSQYSRRSLERFGVAPKGRLQVLSNGREHVDRIVGDESVLTRNGLLRHGYFLTIGSLSPHKNLAILVEALALRRDASLRLVVAGGGNDKVFRSAGLSGSPSLRFLGRVTDAELKSLYENARALLFPSLFEGFGLPPLEAMTCSCAVLGSDIPAIRELCGAAALYGDPNSATDWADGMDRLSGDEELRERLVKRGRVRAAEFSWDASALGLLALIEAQAGRTERPTLDESGAAS